MASALEMLCIIIGVIVGGIVYLLGTEPRRPALKRTGRVIMLLSVLALPVLTALHVYYAWRVDPSYQIDVMKGGSSYSFKQYPAVFVIRAFAAIFVTSGIFVMALLWGVPTSRTAYLRWGWWAALAVLAIASLVLLYWSGWSAAWALVLAVVLSLPGGVQRWLYRDLYAARRAAKQGRHLDSLEMLQRFHGRVRGSGGLQAALWLRWSQYTTRLEAMVLNDIGAASLALGDPVEADRAWRAALEIDKRYPLPYVDLALLAAAKGDPLLADELLGTAGYYGYPVRHVEAAKAQVRRLVDAADVAHKGMVSPLPTGEGNDSGSSQNSPATENE